MKNQHMVKLKNGTEVSWDEFSTWSIKKQNFNLSHYERISEDSIAKRVKTRIGTNSQRSNVFAPAIENGLSRKVMTPKGEYGSINEAALEYGVVCQTITNWIKKNREGFYFITPPRVRRSKAKSTPKNISKKNGRSPRKVLTPDGKFEDVHAAAKYYGVHITRIYSWIKYFRPSEFKFESTQEQIILTPQGQFSGIREAAKKFGITTHAMRSRISSPTWVDFKYAD